MPGWRHPTARCWLSRPPGAGRRQVSSELPTALTVLTEPPQHSSLAGQTPDEVWAIVASFLASSRDLRQLSCTAKRFRNPAAIKGCSACMQIRHLRGGRAG
eukprot:COSAG06_NODE_39963_length_407_cov_0.415584_1_plen_100_part_01